MLYVGARDAVLALDVGQKDTIVLRSKVGEETLMELQAKMWKKKNAFQHKQLQQHTAATRPKPLTRMHVTTYSHKYVLDA